MLFIIEKKPVAMVLKKAFGFKNSPWLWLCVVDTKKRIHSEVLWKSYGKVYYQKAF